ARLAVLELRPRHRLEVERDEGVRSAVLVDRGGVGHDGETRAALATRAVGEVAHHPAATFFPNFLITPSHCWRSSSSIRRRRSHSSAGMCSLMALSKRARSAVAGMASSSAHLV